MGRVPRPAPGPLWPAADARRVGDLSTLLDGPLACVDLETTGGHAAHHRIIEVGVVLMDGGSVVGEWSSLVNPGSRVPPAIERFTGISSDMVAGAPAFADLAGLVLARLDGRVFVAHNARFDYGFLRSEFRRVGVRFKAPVLCSVKLSRRLYPEAPRHSLDAVMERHGLTCSARHRALGDARVVAEFLALLRRERDPAELAAIAADLARATVLPPQLDPELLEELPEGPGVYRFWGEGGVLLYVGKSVNLRTRVLQHFAADVAAARELRLSRQVRHIDWVETAGELGALLTESRWIKDLKPLENRRLKPSDEIVTIRLRPEGGRLVAAICDFDALAGDDWQQAHGLFRARKDARKALEELVRVRQLCARTLGLEAGTGSCFGFQVGRCKGACVGHEPLALHDARVQLALAGLRLRAWPFRGRIAVRERDWRGHEELQVFGNWRWLGTARNPAELAELREAAAGPFDLDAYRTLQRFLDHGARPADIIELP
jgi:DNA polymerase-3 subunit epsilon